MTFLTGFFELSTILLALLVNGSLGKVTVSKAFHVRLTLICRRALYFGFYNMKRLEVLLLPPDAILVDTGYLLFHQLAPIIRCTHLYTSVKRVTVRVMCLA